MSSRGPSIVLRKNCVLRNGGGSYLSTASSDKKKGCQPESTGFESLMFLLAYITPLSFLS